MSIEALDIFRTHLNEILGTDSPISEPATYDPSGTDEADLSGVFDDNTFKSGGATAPGRNTPKREGARFIVSEIVDFDIYENKEIYLPYRERTFIIHYIEHDASGAQVLWLR
ncbi:MAG TPA: hypothetical protein PLI62_00340 [Spirochaetota bacterium]|nr:hypothetical protein [Spirochaetota bacterium]